jgi:hypothetical protein
MMPEIKRQQAMQFYCGASCFINSYYLAPSIESIAMVPRQVGQERQGRQYNFSAVLTSAREEHTCSQEPSPRPSVFHPPFLWERICFFFFSPSPFRQYFPSAQS